MKNEILRVYRNRMRGISCMKTIYRRIYIQERELKPEAVKVAFEMVDDGLLQYHGLNEARYPYFQLKKKGFEEMEKLA